MIQTMQPSHKSQSKESADCSKGSGERLPQGSNGLCPEKSQSDVNSIPSVAFKHQQGGSSANCVTQEQQVNQTLHMQDTPASNGARDQDGVNSKSFQQLMADLEDVDINENWLDELDTHFEMPTVQAPTGPQKNHAGQTSSSSQGQTASVPCSSQQTPRTRAVDQTAECVPPTISSGIPPKPPCLPPRPSEQSRHEAPPLPLYGDDSFPDSCKDSMTGYGSGTLGPAMSQYTGAIGGLQGQNSMCITGFDDTLSFRSEGMCPDRKARVERYREKRKSRSFTKIIRYASRKAYAEVRPRIKGRFVKKEELEQFLQSQKEEKAPAMAPSSTPPQINPPASFPPASQPTGGQQLQGSFTNQGMGFPGFPSHFTMPPPLFAMPPPPGMLPGVEGQQPGSFPQMPFMPFPPPGVMPGFMGQGAGEGTEAAQQWQQQQQQYAMQMQQYMYQQQMQVGGAQAAWQQQQQQNCQLSAMQVDQQQRAAGAQAAADDNFAKAYNRALNGATGLDASLDLGMNVKDESTDLLLDNSLIKDFGEGHEIVARS